MSAYMVLAYDVTDAERFAEYNPGSLEGIFATIAKHGGEGAFAGQTEVLTGSAASHAVCIKFPDADAAKAWLNDDDYAPLKAIRHSSTTNISEYIAPGLG
jgi:uncharacterized protein (DUF1330 family)